jgi:hypothetical protein
LLLAQDPLCTPEGHIFSKEAILKNLLDQKKSNKRKFAAWEAQQQDEQRKVMFAQEVVGRIGLPCMHV